MADLDDFFAKKDRKKAKGKKFTTTEEVAKKLEETGKKVEKVKTKEKPSSPEDEDNVQQIEDEDEWKVFEEKKKDYTGLKIGNLSVVEQIDNDRDDDSGTGENSSDGEGGEAGKGISPWKKPDTSEPEAPPAPVQPPPPPPKEQQQPAMKSSVYKIPALRNAPSTMDHPPVSRLRGKNIAPDINSEEYFPTLNSKLPTNDNTGAWGNRKKRDEGTFEEVRNRGGSRTYTASDTQSQAPKLSLGNKYGALQQDQS